MIVHQQKLKGVTLLEVLLVLAISSSLLVLMLNYTTQKSDELRRDKTVLQMQGILNAGMSFYVSNSFWPLVGQSAGTSVCGTWTGLAALKTNNYVPSTLVNNPYGKPYTVTCSSPPNGGGFFVTAEANSAANAAVIAGRLPMAYRTIPPVTTFPPASCTTGATCTGVVASVNIPGQNLNNARSVNFGSVYYSGSCVPAPNCPPNMKPNILVFPAGVTGVNVAASTCSGYNPPYNPGRCTFKLNPLTSFTAFARGDSNGAPVDPNGTGSGPPLSCGALPASAQACIEDQTSTPTPITTDGTRYWRVCLSVVTDQGTLSPRTSVASEVQAGMGMGSVVAITRCVPNNGTERPTGSVNVYQSP